MAAAINARDLEREVGDDFGGLQTSPEPAAPAAAAAAAAMAPPDAVRSSSASAVQDAQLSNTRQEAEHAHQLEETPERSPRPPSPSPPSSNTAAPTGAAATAKVAMCQMCRKERALYRCPRCLVRTCSLACCNEHKGGRPVEGGERCNGKRDRAAFLYMKDFTDSTMRSDYHFLEDCLNASTGARRTAKAMGCPGGGQVGASPRWRRPGEGGDGGRDEGKGQPSPQAPPPPLLRPRQFKAVRGGDSDGAAVATVAGREAGVISSPDGGGHGHGVGDPKRRRLDIVGGNSESNLNDASSTDGGDQWLTNLGTNLKRLVGQARERGCNLLLMPSGMSRRKCNTTTHNRKRDLITWKVDWVFHHRHRAGCDDGGEPAAGGETPGVSAAAAAATVVSDRFVETSPLSDELRKHLEVGSGGNGCVVNNRATRSLLKDFCSPSASAASAAPVGGGLPKFHLFLKRLPCPSSDPLYVELDPSVSLREALKECTVVEYPQIEVVLPSDAGRFRRLVMEEETDVDVVEGVDDGEAMEVDVRKLEGGAEATTEKTATDVDP